MRIDAEPGPQSPDAMLFERGPLQARDAAWNEASSPSTPYLVTRAWGGADGGRRAPWLMRGARRRYDLLVEEMTDILGRTVIYALAVLGLLHALGLAAVT